MHHKTKHSRERQAPEASFRDRGHSSERHHSQERAERNAEKLQEYRDDKHRSYHHSKERQKEEQARRERRDYEDNTGRRSKSRHDDRLEGKRSHHHDSRDYDRDRDRDRDDAGRKHDRAPSEDYARRKKHDRSYSERRQPAAKEHKLSRTEKLRRQQAHPNTVTSSKERQSHRSESQSLPRGYSEEARGHSDSPSKFASKASEVRAADLPFSLASAKLGGLRDSNDDGRQPSDNLPNMSNTLQKKLPRNRKKKSPAGQKGKLSIAEQCLADNPEEKESSGEDEPQLVIQFPKAKSVQAEGSLQAAMLAPAAHAEKEVALPQLGRHNGAAPTLTLQQPKSSEGLDATKPAPRAKPTSSSAELRPASETLTEHPAASKLPSLPDWVTNAAVESSSLLHPAKPEEPAIPKAVYMSGLVDYCSEEEEDAAPAMATFSKAQQEELLPNRAAAIEAGKLTEKGGMALQQDSKAAELSHPATNIGMEAPSGIVAEDAATAFLGAGGFLYTKKT